MLVLYTNLCKTDREYHEFEYGVDDYYSYTDVHKVTMRDLRVELYGIYTLRTTYMNILWYLVCYCNASLINMLIVI